MSDEDADEPRWPSAPLLMAPIARGIVPTAAAAAVLIRRHAARAFV